MAVNKDFLVKNGIQVGDNAVVTGSLTAAGLAYPVSDGSNRQAITTDGSGNLSFSNVDTVESAFINDTGSLIAKGTPVYQVGVSGSNLTVGLADAGDVNARPAFGVVSSDVSNGATGYVLHNGPLHNIDTSSFSIGDGLYVADGGGYTNVRPSTEAIQVQPIGEVVVAAVNGTIIFDIQGPASLPNLDEGNIFIGNASDVPATIALNTTNVPEGTNLYYTDTRAVDAVEAHPHLTIDGGTLYVDTDNNYVGIGDTSPIAKLDVAGDTNIQGTLTATTAVEIGDHSAGAGAILSWNAVDGTVDMAYDGVTLQVGQEQHFYGKATEAISNGSVVMFAGTQGDHSLFALADMSAPGFMPEWIMGVATQDFANNEFGYVTSFGNVRGIDTSVYTAGDLLYLDAATPGALTTVEPAYPDHSILIAAALNSTNNGTILVRPSHKSDLDELHNVVVSSVATNDILSWNGTNWVNTSDPVFDSATVNGNISVTGTVDGRDVATDGAKLDGIESGATADQTASEIKTAYESNADTNAFTDAEQTKLAGIESGATADQTKADIDALGIDAATLDGLDSTQFLRKDTSDTQSGGLSVDKATGYALYIEADDPTQSPTGNSIAVFRDGNTASTDASGSGSIGITSSPGYDVYIGKRWNLSLGQTFGTIGNGSAEHLSLNMYTGKLGIGNNSPSAKLDITGVTEQLYLRHPNADELTWRVDQYGTTGTDAGPLMRMYDQAGNTTVNIDSRSGSTRHTFFNNGGNVGIGTNNPSQKLDVAGNISHTGLTMTDGTDIDQIKSFTKSLTVTTSWQDTGIYGSQLATGVYAFSVYAENFSVGGGHYFETYCGMLSWYASNTNNPGSNEIITHHSGHADGGHTLYFRTQRTYNADARDLVLEIASDVDTTGPSNYIFKFRRLM